ncbi:hypothetical protein [Paenibacillus sp. PL2-23]|uniref:hypothetical protein n=1 Tax=Paenibacillus sp. PL2-23 TaxID=2100729 RepID=UPI0030F982F5
MSEPIRDRISSIPLPSELGERGRQGILQAAAELSERRRRRRLVGITAAVIAGITLISALSWNSGVMASIQKALQFVPGFGVVANEDENKRLVLKELVRHEVRGGFIVIKSVSVDSNMAYIEMNGDGGSWFGEQLALEQNGQAFILKRSMSVSSLRDWSAAYWYDGKLELESGHVMLNMRASNQDFLIPLSLEYADSYASYEELGPTATKHDISITAVLSQFGDRTRIYLAARHPDDFRISNYGVIETFGKQLTVQDDQGTRYEIEKIQGISAPGGDFTVQLLQLPDRSYSLTIPHIAVTYRDETSIMLAAETNLSLDKTIKLAGYPITITGTELIGENSMRVYVDVHRDEAAASSLVMFDLQERSHMIKLNDEMDAMLYTEFEIEPDEKAVKLKLANPDVIWRGPWVLELNP